jgi:serine/threonine-protein kinase RsbW
MMVSEVVIDAADHARAVMTLQLKLGWQYLDIAVFDGVRAEPVLSHDQQPDTGAGNGLVLVQSLSQRWGSDLRDDGKAVWAALPSHRTDSALSRSQVRCR